MLLDAESDDDMPELELVDLQIAAAAAAAAAVLWWHSQEVGDHDAEERREVTWARELVYLRIEDQRALWYVFDAIFGPEHSKCQLLQRLHVMQDAAPSQSAKG